MSPTLRMSPTRSIQNARNIQRARLFVTPSVCVIDGPTGPSVDGCSLSRPVVPTTCNMRSRLFTSTCIYPVKKRARQSNPPRSPEPAPAAGRNTASRTNRSNLGVYISRKTPLTQLPNLFAFLRASPNISVIARVGDLDRGLRRLAGALATLRRSTRPDAFPPWRSTSMRRRGKSMKQAIRE